MYLVSIYLSIDLCIDLSNSYKYFIYLSIDLSIYLFIYLSIYLVDLKEPTPLIVVGLKTSILYKKEIATAHVPLPASTGKWIRFELDELERGSAEGGAWRCCGLHAGWTSL